MQEMDRLSRPLIVCLLATLTCLLWGSAAPAIKTGYKLLSISRSDTWSIVLFAGMRFSLAGLLVIVFASVRDRRLAVPEKCNWGNVVKLGLVQTTGQYILNYIGVAHASSVNASILNGAANLWAIVLACVLFRHEKMTIKKALGCVLGFGGILVMSLTGKAGGVTFMGEGMMLLSSLCGGISGGLSKIYTKKEDPVVLTGWQFLIGGMIMCAMAFLLGGRVNITSVSAGMDLLYLSLVSAVAYTLWNVLIRHNDVSTVTVYGFLVPLFGVLISAVAMGEYTQAVSVNTLIALVMVCCGVFTISVAAGRKRI